jgi:DNA-binding PadR family transcriptional regulator
MERTTRAPDITMAAFYVLVALASGEAHGYGVMRYVEELSDGRIRLPAGTLYRTMARLVGDGLVEEMDERDPEAPHDARRRYYRMTPLGLDVARSEAGLLMRVVEAAASAGLITSHRDG